MTPQGFIGLAMRAFRREVLKKIVFSRPLSSEDAAKIVARPVIHRSQKLLACEFSLSGDTVAQRNLREGEIEAELESAIARYGQVNLLTTLGDAECKQKKGEYTILGGDKLLRKLELSAETPAETAFDTLDRKKNYILTGEETFLRVLGISDKDGRVHDKKQGKFRQINRFLELLGDRYAFLPESGTLRVFDLCSGKSYLSFAVYYYLTEIKGRQVDLLALDLKRDVILACEQAAKEIGFSGMCFAVDDVRNTPTDLAPDLVISLHACDIATDIVLETAIGMKAGMILSTPCCHAYLASRIRCDALSFVTDSPKLSGKLCEALTDALRLLHLRASGYEVGAVELVDPDDTPKNTLLWARRTEKAIRSAEKYEKEYREKLCFLLGDGAENYLKDVLS